MKKIFKIKSLVAVASLLFAIGCSSDDDVNDQPNNPITVQDFSAIVDENPTNGQSLGTVQASSNETLTYSISTSTPLNALSIDVNTGELTVADETLFDYETNPTITATITVENSTKVENLTVTINIEDKPEIGEFKFGGVIFWINTAGNEGLVCATSDQSTGIRWNNGSNVGVGATAAIATGIGTGQSNTATIINAQGAGAYAARVCGNLILNGYDDWFLPSKDELFEILNNKTIIDATALANSGTSLATQYYWSSSEIDAGFAVVYWESNGTVYYAEKAKTTQIYHVRAVRHWTDF